MTWLGLCPNCLCCNWESNPSSRYYGCSGVCDLVPHTKATPRFDVQTAVLRYVAIDLVEAARDGLAG